MPAVLRVLLPCTGLGRVQRGFETFTADLAKETTRDSSLHVVVLGGAKGEGRIASASRTVPNLRRDNWATRVLGTVCRQDGYFIEQTTFAFGMIPIMLTFKPHVILYSDGKMGNTLARIRRTLRMPFKLLLSNGAPFCPPFLPAYDHIHQVTPWALNVALDAGIPSNFQTMLPYGVAAKREFRELQQTEQLCLRAQLKLPLDQPIVLTVGAVNKLHKRIDYVISEVARLPRPRPFLVVLGQRESETSALEAQATHQLGPDGWIIRTVPSAAIGDYYRAADYFVLASLSEGFGRVFVEAMLHGLPIISHKHPVAEYVLDSHGILADLTRDGSLTNVLTQQLARHEQLQQKKARVFSAYDRFSWDVLRVSYSRMLHRAWST